MSLDLRAHVEARHADLFTPDYLRVPSALAELHPRADGFMEPYEAAEAMGISELEVRRLAAQGALEIRGRYVRPALVTWIVVA